MILLPSHLDTPMPGRRASALFWCLGMYGSASTWTFNVVRQLAAAILPDRPVIAQFVSDSCDGLDAPDATVVVKTHAAPAASAIAERASKIIITVRDPRDAVASLMAHNKAPFDLALEATAASVRMCADYAADRRAMLLRFEDRFFERAETIAQLAATFPGTLSTSDFDRIFRATRREAIDAFIATLDELPGVTAGFDTVTGQQDMYDPQTNWHRHHAGRRGESGRWRRELLPDQSARIEARLNPWMQRFHYRPEASAHTQA